MFGLTFWRIAYPINFTLNIAAFFLCTELITFLIIVIVIADLHMATDEI